MAGGKWNDESIMYFLGVGWFFIAMLYFRLISVIPDVVLQHRMIFLMQNCFFLKTSVIV